MQHNLDLLLEVHRVNFCQFQFNLGVYMFGKKIDLVP